MKKKVKLKYFITPFLLVTIAYAYLIYGTMARWIETNYDHIRKDSYNVARVYSLNLQKSAKAKDMLYDLIDERLLMASKSMTNEYSAQSNALMAQWAKELNVEVIYAYSADGIILYANTEEHIGWRAPEGHPTRDFMESGEIIRVDEVRKNAVNDEYYKYSYARLYDGRFYQIGVSAKNIDGFLSEFEIKELLQKIGSDHTLVYAHLIDDEKVIVESTISQDVGFNITDEDVVKAINSNREYDQLTKYNGEDVYEVYVPVYVDQLKIGTLAIGQEAESFLNNILSLIGNGLWILLSIIIIMAVFVITIYNKSDRHFKLAYYDHLTKLPNNTYMKEFLGTKIKSKKHVNKAIFMINLRNFRTINIAMGFEVGDMIIKEISKRLEAALNKKGMLFRFTDDRFILYIEGYQNKEDLTHMSDIITKAFEKPFQYPQKSKQIQPEIGIVEINDRYKTVDDLLKDASIAITYIENGIGNTLVFSAQMRNQVDREEILELELTRSYKDISENIIHLEYQPKIDSITNQIVGFEALARMNSKKLGVVSPTEFIDVAERKQLILPLGTMIMEKACIFTKKLVDQGYKDIRMAINVSGIQLLMDDFFETVTEIIRKTGINCRNLELEITETVLLENYTIINGVLQKLRNMGVEISMDDFGTGFSSLASIGELNIDIVKIDRHFITKIVNGFERNLITTDIISMAHKLGLQVIAEGVETSIQKEYLIKNGCDVMQGYYFSRPISEIKAEEMLRTPRS